MVSEAAIIILKRLGIPLTCLEVIASEILKRMFQLQNFVTHKPDLPKIMKL